MRQAFSFPLLGGEVEPKAGSMCFLVGEKKRGWGWTDREEGSIAGLVQKRRTRDGQE